MDYRGSVAGVTMYFPAFVPGALIHIGDEHAIQGDGEIAGLGNIYDPAYTMVCKLRKSLLAGRAEESAR